MPDTTATPLPPAHALQAQLEAREGEVDALVSALVDVVQVLEAGGDDAVARAVAIARAALGPEVLDDEVGGERFDGVFEDPRD